MRCKDCSHSADAHANGECVVCGCVRLNLPDRKAREERKRSFLASVMFLTRRGWVRHDTRVKALSVTGASMKAVQSARREALPKGTRVSQVKLEITAIRRSGGQ